MAKTSGKTAGKTAEQERQKFEPDFSKLGEQVFEQEAPAAPAAGTKEKQPNVFLNRISEKMIREVPSAKDGKDWTSVSFGYPMTGPDGKPAIGSILVRSNQVMDSTRKGKDGEIVPNPGFKNVLLGQPNQHYNVSLNIKDENGNYINERLSAADIKAKADEANKAYRAAKKTQQKDAQGVEAPAAEAPQAEDEGLEA